MQSRTFRQLQRMLDDASGGLDPSDPRERKRLRIVEAATDLFIRRGYRNSSVDAVAKAAGVAKGTVYLYARTKAELLIQAIIEEKKRYINRLAPILDGDLAPKERLRQYLRASLVLATEMPLVSRLLSGDREVRAVLDEIDAGLLESGQAMQIGFVSELLDEAASPHRWTSEELADRAGVVLGFFHFSGVMSDERIRGGLSIDRYAGILVDMLVDGIAGEQTRATPPGEGGH
jgi:AcrR family transcriptional regulator